MLWDLFVIVLAIWNSVTLPIEISFEVPFFDEIIVVVINIFIDILFAVDIVVSFLTTFHSLQTGDEIVEPKPIAINYIKGRFWIDLIATIPFDLIS